MQLSASDGLPPIQTIRRRQAYRLGKAATSIHIAASLERSQTERFLEAAYSRAFDGRLRSHYPVLFGVRDAAGEVIAAAGVRPARSGPLFLERYLDRPIELAIVAPGEASVDRAAIVEIGSLAAARHGAALQLFEALASHLADSGASHVAVTATRGLRRTFSRLGFPWRALAPADPARIDGAEDWGRYYDTDPQVIAGPLRQGLDRLRAHPAAGR